MMANYKKTALLCIAFCTLHLATASKFFDPYGLTTLQEGRGMRASSSAVDWANSNGDARGIQPGDTLVLADLEGPGIIRHIWNTVNCKEYSFSKLLVIKIYWDGEEDPSVNCPLGDFFGVGHGMNVNFDSNPVRVSADGVARNCYWPMPFEKSARVTITNEGKKPVEAFYYYVDWTKLPSLPENTPYFHAMYRQEYPCVAGSRYLIADIQGAGHYVGTVLNCRQHERGWMGEGDDFFFIDGEEEPSLRGTGTEDYFCDAWGFRESDGPFYGVNVYEGYEIQDRTTVYRWHIPDPVPFKKSLRLEMEHWGWWWVKDKDGKDIIDDGTRADDWSTVAYWYQIGPHRPYEKMPVGYDRLYYDWTHIVEAESLKGKASVDKGTIDQWGGTFASGHGYLHWSANEPGGTFEIPFMVEKPGEYSLVLAMFRQPHFGTFEFLIDGEKTGKTLNLHHPDLSAREYALDTGELKAGEHKLTVRNLDKHFKSIGYCFGLDGFLLVPKK
ncbi:MAG: hypothetical protein DRP64_00210 [Verrucomicrobia bacterium]|nr:MAG: hypothetical protein DRP64_00210 [Verrucomicrobiota bacterium]